MKKAHGTRRSESTPEPTGELPRDLMQRKRIYNELLPLKDLLFPIPRESGRIARLAPVLLPINSSGRTALEREIHVEPQRHEIPFKIANSLAAHNLRLADIAEICQPLKGVLLLAGLHSEDIEWWEAHAIRAKDVRRENGIISTDDGHYYVHARGFSLYEINDQDQMKEAWPGVAITLGRADGLMENLALVVDRIDRTLSREAVLERFRVDREKAVATLDEQVFSHLRKGELIYLDYVRQMGGDWISSPMIETLEGIKDFKVPRYRTSLLKQHPRLMSCIDVGSPGSRIVLPLAPMVPLSRLSS